MTLIEFLKKYQNPAAAFVLWCVIFGVYITTISRSVGYIDSGELAAVVHTVGIAHPSGYPLFTLLGKIFSFLPVADEIIVRLNVLSALLTSAAAILFYFFLRIVLSTEKRSDDITISIPSILAALSLAFSKTFWMQAVAVEVYSLHVLLLCGSLFLAAKAVATKEPLWWVLFAFIVGLSFSNHLTTFLLGPGMLYWFFAENGFNKNSIKRTGLLSLPFVAGFSLNVFMLIRAPQHPLLNWGNPQTLEKFWWHLTGKQFRIWLFSSGDVAQKQFNNFLNNLPNEFHFIILILAVIGLFPLLWKDKKKFFAFGILLFTCVGYSINYDIHDIDSYFLLAFIVIAALVGFGIQALLMRRPKKEFQYISAMIIVGVIAFQLNENFPKTNQRNNFLVEDYTKNILFNLPPNAIVLSQQWDYFISASYYYQHVNHIRPDVVILDKELFRRSWYFPQLEQMYPLVIKNSKMEIELFLQELYKFEHNLPYQYEIIEGRYRDLLMSFIKNNNGRFVYITSEIDQSYTSGYFRIPEGFVYRLTKDTAYSRFSFSNYQFRQYQGNDPYTKSLKNLMSAALINRASYEQFFKNDSNAAYFLKKSAEINPKSIAPVSNF